MSRRLPERKAAATGRSAAPSSDGKWNFFDVLVVAVLNGQQRLPDERGSVALGEGPDVGLGLCDDAVEELAALIA